MVKLISRQPYGKKARAVVRSRVNEVQLPWRARFNPADWGLQLKQKLPASDDGINF
jgi:hypothetical protein